MGLVQSATRRPERTHAVSAPSCGRIGPSGFKRHVDRREWAPSFARRLHTRTNPLLDQPREQGPLSAALAPDHSLTSPFTGTCSPHGRSGTLSKTQHTNHLLGRRHRNLRHGTGKVNSRTRLYGTHRLCRTDHPETVTGRFDSLVCLVSLVSLAQLFY